MQPLSGNKLSLVAIDFLGKYGLPLNYVWHKQISNIVGQRLKILSI